MKLFVVLTLVFASSVFAQTPSPSASASAKHPFTFEDMMKLKRLDEPVPSPNGRQRIRLLAPDSVAGHNRNFVNMAPLQLGEEVF